MGRMMGLCVLDDRNFSASRRVVSKPDSRVKHQRPSEASGVTTRSGVGRAPEASAKTNAASQKTGEQKTNIASQKAGEQDMGGADTGEHHRPSQANRVTKKSGVGRAPEVSTRSGQQGVD